MNIGAASCGPFLFGPPSMADAMYAPVVLRFQTYDIKPDAVCEAHCRRILAMPAMLEWIDAAMGADEEELEFEGEF